MTLLIRKAKIEDAEEIIKLIIVCSDESDFMACGSKERNFNLSKERVHIQESYYSNNSAIFICEYDKKIIGILGIDCPTNRTRFKHRVSLGMNILKEFWGIGAGTKLMESAIEFFHSKNNLTKFELEVRTDNERAINLYKKFGFIVQGEITKYFYINGIYYPAFIMGLEKDSIPL